MKNLKTYNQLFENTKIKKDDLIKDIIFYLNFSEEQSYTSGELMLDSSVVFFEDGNTIHLIEVYFKTFVEIVVYGGYKYSIEEYTYSKKYEELSIDILEEIYSNIRDGIGNNIIELDLTNFNMNYIKSLIYDNDNRIEKLITEQYNGKYLINIVDDETKQLIKEKYPLLYNQIMIKINTKKFNI